MDSTQEHPPFVPAQPTEHHRWLEKLVGTWNVFEKEDSAEPMGSEVVESHGGMWVVATGKMPMPDGSEATSFMTLGYDPAKGKYVGTWIGTVMTHIWVYLGDLENDTLTLEAEGPGPDGTTGTFRDVVTLHSEDHRTLSSYGLQPDGTWAQFMEMHYRRVVPPA